MVDLFGADVKLAIGPAIENGFYYDFLKETPFVPEDLPRIEQRMDELIAANLVMEGKPIERQAALRYYEERKQPFKLDIVRGIPEGRAADDVHDRHVHRSVPRRSRSLKL